ncbi:uncharacterized protein RCC_08905 [Ramularia collo-cygni]|uniref:Mediator of RNA polymerase II transcription subunit 8 n=1 Tax=Ramularia collo-cygni TaxID=112498 RepID=A0A2D3VBY0_9PEZI|nr:uncharacterized protein RCC_08905 [Ramularia collo-cygni]CZT23195.1 uncharacterized protein RCC_08905 [Ramularia collo-cygni]
MTTPEYRALEQLRTRLQQLSASIHLFRHELEASQPLPPWPACQTASSNLAGTLQNTAQVLASNRSLFSSAHAYPNASFPGLTQEALLQQLLRKKMDPKAEDWMDRELDKQPDNVEDRGELWQWAGGVVKEMRTDLEGGLWEDYFTTEEHKSGVKEVRTGIRRTLWGDNDDGDEDAEDDDGEGGEDEDGDKTMKEDGAVGSGRTVESAVKKAIVPPIPLESLLRFSVGGLSLPTRAKGRDVAG